MPPAVHVSNLPLRLRCWAAARHAEQVEAACHDDIPVDAPAGVKPWVAVDHLLHHQGQRRFSSPLPNKPNRP